MTPEEYRESLDANGAVRVPLSVHAAFRDDLNRALFLVSQSGGEAAAVVNLGRSRDQLGDFLLVPNDPQVIRELLTAIRAAEAQTSDSSVRLMVSDLAVRVSASTSVAAEPRHTPRQEPAGEACVRSPCADPKTTEAEVQAATVGAPKARRRLILTRHKTGRFYPPEHKRAGQEIVETKPRFVKTEEVNRPRDNASPLTVALGLGVDSVAILVGLVQLWRETRDDQWIPDAITFADVGSEKRATYDYLALVDDYLAKNEFPRVTVVATAQGFVRPKWGSYRTLEQKCLINHTLPTIAFGFRKAECSITWKHVPQHEFFAEKYSLSLFGGRGPRIIRAVGYDVDELERACGKGGRSTYRTHEEAEKAGDVYEFWYPLVEWNWSRPRCIAEIRAEVGREPPKSSCTFCPAMKAFEILDLARTDPEALERAIFMEQVAKLGRRPLTQAGLNPAWSWTALALADESGLPSRGEILDLVRRTGPVISQERVRELIELAKRWADASPRAPFTRDMSDHPITDEVQAFIGVKGFRGTERMDMDKADIEAEEAGS